ncbi:MAG: hypothetical protein ING09_15790 [Roseomonas sp.]|nr:hypothetical protein [Roseomonas sp.]MCA3289575.1 hypothetical protein [Roseomonas sp.]MCA3293290.1 hypothetical protein [Roseomonas sp.]
MRVVRSQIRRWWLLAVLAVSALGYIFVRTDQFQFWDGLVGNLVATLLGIIAGVPVALHLERRRAANEAKEKKREEIRIKKEMLTLLREELQDNSNRLQRRVDLKPSIPIEPLKMSSWVALRESGDLKYISEPNLISCIANFYRFLAIIQDREEHFMQCQYGAGNAVKFDDGEAAPQKILSIIFHFHSPALESFQVAFAAIEKALNEP